MNQYVRRLYQLGSQESRLIVGLMSGTSLDGLDVALCEVIGSGLGTQVKLLQFETVPYNDEFRNRIRKVFARKEIDFEYLCVLNPLIGIEHGKIVLSCLQNWTISTEKIAVIASHGQTVYHAPKKQHGRSDFPNATLQIGDGDHIAVTTGIVTLSDFRQKHIAAGGEGAPLAVYGDYLLFSSPHENRILLNMGGIANFTFLPATLDAGKVFTTDTGPGNTLIDLYCRHFFGMDFDQDGEIAKTGEVNEGLLQVLGQHPFFESGFPKTTGPEVFNKPYVENAQKRSGTLDIAPRDLIATLTRFSADTIVKAISSMRHDDNQYTLYASGGGAHNPLLMKYIQEGMPGIEVRLMEDLGIPGDAKEAVLFAVLANETLAGGLTDFGNREGIPSVSMGKISFPG